MREYSIAAIPGDGIGVEVIAAGLKALDVLASRDRGFKLNIEHFEWSSDYYLRNGYYIPEGELEKLKRFDAIFFGAVGVPNVPDHVSLWGLRLPICQGFDQYANVRPARVLPGITSPLRNGEQIDWVIIRENSGRRVFRKRRARTPGPAGRGGDGNFSVHAQWSDANTDVVTEAVCDAL